jgi:hypothetical protein
MKKSLMYLSLLLLFFSGSNKTSRMGYQPIYAPEAEAKEVIYMEPQELKNQGKIYVKDDFIYIGDVDLGIHVIDNSDPENPQKIGFLRIYGNKDIAIKGTSLYADNFEDLITVDISDLNHPVVTKRMEDVYQVEGEMYPPNVPYGTYFECVDKSKGYVIGWKEVESDNLRCFTINEWGW